MERGKYPKALISILHKMQKGGGGLLGDESEGVSTNQRRLKNRDSYCRKWAGKNFNKHWRYIVNLYLRKIILSKVLARVKLEARRL